MGKPILRTDSLGASDSNHPDIGAGFELINPIRTAGAEDAGIRFSQTQSATPAVAGVAWMLPCELKAPAPICYPRA